MVYKRFNTPISINYNTNGCYSIQGIVTFFFAPKPIKNHFILAKPLKSTNKELFSIKTLLGISGILKTFVKLPNA